MRERNEKNDILKMEEHLEKKDKRTCLYDKHVGASGSAW